MTPRWLLAALIFGTSCQEGPPPPPFDGQAALAYVTRQVAFGPRIPGTEAHRRMGDWLDSLLTVRADTLVVQAFDHVTLAGDTLPLRNFLARFRPEAEDRILLVAHWDTRPRADAAGSANKDAPVPGANDGGSGVAVLLGVADAIASAGGPPRGVDLLLVDGEDYGVFADSAEGGERTTFSARFACPVSGFTIDEIEPRLFSFNNPYGACPACDGLGTTLHFDPELTVPDEGKSLADGAIRPWANSTSPYYRQTLGAGAGGVSFLFLWFGAFGLLGNLLLSRGIDRWGATRCVNFTLTLMALSLAAWPLAGSVSGMALVLVPWALGCFSSNSAQQARLSSSAPAYASALLALNTSAIYVGQAVGAGGGGALLAAGGYAWLPWAALAWMAAAIGLSLWVARRMRPGHG